MPLFRIHSIRLSAACALTLTLGAAVAASALASDESPRSAGPITTNTGDRAGTDIPLPALLNASIETIQGTRVAPGACKYTSSLRLAPDQTAVREDTLRMDPATCRMTVRRGTPADAPEAKRSTSEAGTAAIVGHSAGYFMTWLTDPPGWTVNSVRNDVDWRWDGTHVAQGTCGARYTWLGSSGWQKIADSHSCLYEAGQSQLHGSSFAHYLNRVFCAGIDTRAEYNRNNVYGMANGWLRGDSSVVAWGGCTSLLTARKELRRTL